MCDSKIKTMKIFTAEQNKKADQITLKQQKITSLELMERASHQAFEKIKKKISCQKKPIHIFCGMGNNGGDGLVIARKLSEIDFLVKVYVVEYMAKSSEEMQENLKRLQEESKVDINFLKEDADFPEIEKEDWVIDAIFGLGLNRPLANWVERLMVQINKSGAYIFSIDLPSGMTAELEQVSNVFIKANETLTFQAGKIPFYLPETAEYVGKIRLLEIGLDQEFLASLTTDFELLEEKFLRKIYRKRKQFSHKGSFGHILIAGGKYGMMGSMVLATRSALRIGAGKVTALIPKSGNEIMQISIPEAMTLTEAGQHQLNRFVAPKFSPEVICFGMGAGTDQKTADFFLDLMKFSKNPMLIDADGLNLLSKFPVLLEFIPENSVLTPHPKELERLIGKWGNDADKINKAKIFAKKHQLILVIKGAYSLILTEEKIYVNSTGNPGMATAGSGDVLSGIIAGLMGQGYSPEEATLLGVWLHGKAGDLGVQKSCEEVLIAGDIILNFGRAFRKLVKK